MKRIIKKTSIFLLIALFAVCTVVGMTTGNIFAEARDTTVRGHVELSDNLGGKGLVKGKSFILTLTVTMGAELSTADLYYTGLAFYIAPIKSPTAETQEIDYDTADKLNAKRETEGSIKMAIVDSNLTFDAKGYTNTSSNDLFHVTTASKGMCYFGISFSGGANTMYRLSTVTAATLSAEITVDSDIEADELYFTVYTGANSIGQTPISQIGLSNGYIYSATGSGTKDKGRFDCNVLTIPLKDETEDNSLESLEIGPTADALTEVDMTVETPTYTIDKAMDQMVVKPVAGAPECATVKVGVVDALGTTEVVEPANLAADGTVTLSSIPAHGQKIKVTVTSQVGESADYFVTIVISYARLAALTSDVAPAEGTTLGFQETLGSDVLATTFEYTLHVPTVQAVQLTPTVLAGYGISETVAVAATSGGTVAAATVSDGTAATVTMTDATCVVTLTVTAADGTTTQAYTVTILSTDVSITAFTLTGDSGTVYNSDDGMATGNSVDYFFSVDKETTVQGKMNIVAALGATVQVDGSDYDANTVQPKGEHTVTVTAVAGNSKVYKVKINAPEYLELKDGSYYQFLCEYVEEGYRYRIAYQEMPEYDLEELVHGVNDTDLPAFVLGQIRPMTPIGEFLNHIKPSSLPFVQLCFEDEGEDFIIYDRGEYEDPDYAYEIVCTSFYIKFGSGETPSEIIYLSVLGDVNCDGVVNPNDGTVMQTVINGMFDGSVNFEDYPIEVRLAGLLDDSGEWGPICYSTMANITGELINAEDLFWFPDGYEVPDEFLWAGAGTFSMSPMMLAAANAEEVVVAEVRTAPRLAVNTQEPSEDATEEPAESEEPGNNQPVVPSRKYGYTDWDVKEKTND